MAPLKKKTDRKTVTELFRERTAIDAAVKRAVAKVTGKTKKRKAV